MNLLVEVSPGELVDKLTVLAIKLKFIEGEAKRANVQLEYDALMGVYAGEIAETAALRALWDRLEAINQEIWDFMDELRRLDTAGQYDARYIDVTRRTCALNDERSVVKRDINTLLNSRLIEEKNYS